MWKLTEFVWLRTETALVNTVMNLKFSEGQGISVAE
jgi:hypothetical protein